MCLTMYFVMDRKTDHQQSSEKEAWTLTKFLSQFDVVVCCIFILYIVFYSKNTPRDTVIDKKGVQYSTLKIVHALD